MTVAYLTIAAINTNQLKKKPRLSIITSIFDGDEFIEGFLKDITKQTIFKDCELILINANSPGNEEKIINKFIYEYPNIFYFKLPNDPGLYATWNRGIKIASADLICNANIDDRSSFDSFEKHVKELEANPHLDLVYSDYYLTNVPNETFENNHYSWYVKLEEFAPKNMFKCLPGPRPIWRKSMHERFGFFDESFTSSGDFEMWNRAMSLGSKLKKIPGVYTLNYLNPKGISTDKEKTKALKRYRENEKITLKYRHLWK